MNKLWWLVPLPNSITNLLRSWHEENGKSVLSSIWIILPSMVIWELWKERNKKIFQDKWEGLDRLCGRIQWAISEIISSAKHNHNFVKHPYSLMDSLILARWPLITLRPIHGFPRVNLASDQLDREMVKWSKLEKGWVKINFDGPSKGYPSILGVGCVACDDEENVPSKGARSLLEEEMFTRSTLR